MSSVLKNKTYKSYNYTSRYSPFPYYYHSNDDKYVYGLTSYLDNTTPYSLYTVEQGDTYDSLSLKFYNNPTYYWIICSFNHISNPFSELVVGQKIKIPSLSNLRFDIQGRV